MYANDIFYKNKRYHGRRLFQWSGGDANQLIFLFGLIIVPCFFLCRFWLNIGGVLIGINLAIGAYFILWVSYYLKISDWDSHNTILIPIATAAFIAGMIW